MVKFESYKIPLGINNQTTQPLTIKSIRKLRNDEHKMIDYDFNSPYEVKIEEETVYTDISRQHYTSNSIWFFAHADNLDAQIISDADVFYYFVSNLGKKVQIPLRNKYIDQYGQTIYSIRNEEEVINCIVRGKVDYQTLEGKKITYQEIKDKDNSDEQEIWNKFNKLNRENELLKEENQELRRDLSMIEKTLDIRSNKKIDQEKLNVYKVSKSDLDAIKKIISPTLNTNDEESNKEDSVGHHHSQLKEDKNEKFQDYSESSKFKRTNIKQEEKNENTENYQNNSVIFESYKIPWGVDYKKIDKETGKLTIKGVRKLDWSENTFGRDYNNVNPIYRVDIEEDVICVDNKGEFVISHFIRFFAHADYVNTEQNTFYWDANAPIFYYFISNLGKKINVPLWNKCPDKNNYTYHSVRGDKEILEVINQEKKRWDELGYTEIEDLKQSNKKLVDRGIHKNDIHKSSELLEVNTISVMVAPIMPPELGKEKDKLKEDYAWKERKIEYKKVHLESPLSWKINENESFELPLRLVNIDNVEENIANDQMENIQVEGTMGRADIKNYAILSYVWGEKKEGERLSQGGKKTLIKAVEACRALDRGINYLWMDQLCINQKDEKEKAQEVAKMRQYYSNASVTLVVVHAKVGSELLAEEDKLGILKMITSSEWFTRSWTFQEGWLSKQTLFMFDDYLVDGRSLAATWTLKQPSYTDYAKYDSIEESSRGLKKIATPIGWVHYNGEYTSKDRASLNLSQALRTIKERGRSVAIDGIYSILGLLPYGEQVMPNYKTRMCPDCPDQKEIKGGCQHKEKNKKWPTYTVEDIEQALIDVMKVAVKYGYAEPLSWHGLSGETFGLCWIPSIVFNEFPKDRKLEELSEQEKQGYQKNGSTSVEGGMNIYCKPGSINFTEKGIEIFGSKYIIVKPLDDNATSVLKEGFYMDGGVWKREFLVELDNKTRKVERVILSGTHETLSKAEERDIIVLIDEDQLWESNKKKFAMLVSRKHGIYHRLGLVEFYGESENLVGKTEEKLTIGAREEENISQHQSVTEIPPKGNN